MRSAAGSAPSTSGPRRRSAAVGLLTGGAFEVLDVPQRLGDKALQRHTVRGLVGPLARTGGGRYHFYVTAIGMTNGFVPSQPGAGRSESRGSGGRLERAGRQSFHYLANTKTAAWATSAPPLDTRR
ncbi:MAG TPA: hypothetical protein VE776_01655 [Actinomycetota bacterium]|nr:hypothetical protein [Actinomycetota bacterium]